MAVGAGPIDDLTLETLFGLFRPEGGVLLAVSGGPDSMALLRLAARWHLKAGWDGSLGAATVDHGLRPESAAEAAFVRDTCASLGLPHATLPWMGEKPSTGLQAAARAARYALLADAARRQGCTAIATAHTLDDQAETVLMRLAHGSGVTGIGAMRAASERNGLRLLRPLLDLPKARLIDHLETLGQPFVDDPSNGNDRFERVRWRRLMPGLARAGLDAERLSTFARRAAETSDALSLIASRFPIDIAADGTSARWDRKAWQQEPRAIRLEIIATAVRAVVGPAADIRLERLEALEAAISAHAGPLPLRRTLAGCVVSVGPVTIQVRRETARRRGRRKGPDVHP